MLIALIPVLNSILFIVGIFSKLNFGGIYIIFNYEVRRFEFSVTYNEFYLFWLFGGFNVSLYNASYYLLGQFEVFIHLIPVIWFNPISIIIDFVIVIFMTVMEI